MSHELFYTSAPRGLRTGEHGFCTVAATRGIPAALAAKLESLCAYRHVFPPADRRANLNPVLYAHLRVQVDGKVYHVLSRIADAGLDYSQRTNKFAHHVALERNELPPGGPAHALLQRGFMEAEWGDRPPQVIEVGRRPNGDDAPPRRCQRWEEATGDAGWGGVLAGMTTANKPAYLIFRPGVDPLPLIAESLALLPPQQRWGVTFSTYFLGLPPDVPCQWRCLVEGSQEAKAVLESGNDNVIVLDRDQGPVPDGPLVEAARTGRVRHEAAATARPARAATPVASPAPVAVRVPATAAVPAAHAEPNVAAYVPESQSTPVVEAPPSAGRFGVLSLLLGLALGLALMCLCILPVELLTGRSLPRFAGLVGRDEQEMRSRLDELQRDLEREKKRGESLQADLAATKDALAEAEKRPPPDDSHSPWPGWIRGLVGARELAKLKEERDALKKKVEELEKRLADLERLPKPGLPMPRPVEAPPLLPNPAAPKDPAAPKEPMPGNAGGAPTAGPPAKQELRPPLQLHQSAVGKPVALRDVKHEKGASPELLGLPSNSALLSRSAQPGLLVAKSGDATLATFQQKPDGEWEFTWANDAAKPEYMAARSALLRCVLKLKLADNIVQYYPLQPPEPIKPAFMRTPGEKETFFNADLPIDGVSLGDSADVALDGGFPVSAKRQGGKLVGQTGNGDRQIEVTLVGATLQVRISGQKFQAEKCTVEHLTLKREFEGLKIDVATITK